FVTLSGLSLLFTLGATAWSIQEFYDSTLLATRNFYGVLRVQEFGGDTASRHRSLIHGTILHGTQYLLPKLTHRPTTYYTPTSGIGRAIESLHPSITPLRIGVIGLGTGTLAVYGSKGDLYRFYDINPAVIGIANRDFSYIRDSDATVETSLGDARLSLEREKPKRLGVAVRQRGIAASLADRERGESDRCAFRLERVDGRLQQHRAGDKVAPAHHARGRGRYRLLNERT